MPIDGLSSTSSLIAALRAELARKGEATAKSGASEKTGNAQRSHGSGRHDAALLRRELADLVKGISPDDEQAMSDARPRIVRAVLLWEFGPELREYAEWQPMLERIVGTLEANPQHREQVAELIRELRR